MIQRIQSVLLLLAAVANFVLIFSHIGYYSNVLEDTSAEAYGSKIVITPPFNADFDVTAWVEHREAENPENVAGLGEDLFHTIHFVLVLLNSAYLIFLIFLYRDRARQMKLAYMGIVMLMVQLVIAALFVMKLPDFVNAKFSISADPNAQAGPSYPLALAVIALLLTWMAARRINKDEQLVRDADRLR